MGLGGTRFWTYNLGDACITGAILIFVLIAFFPGLALMIAVFCFNLLGDGLRDIVDPQRRT